MTMTDNNKTNWGGRRDGAGRPPVKDKEERKLLTLNLHASYANKFISKAKIEGLTQTRLMENMIDRFID